MKNFLFFLYGLILVGVTVFSYAFIDQNLIYYHNFYTGFAFQNRFATTILYTTCIILLFLFYGAFIYLFKKGQLHHKDSKTLIIITCLTLFFAYPAMLSYDIFNYLTTAKVLFFHHENPYIIMPIDFLGEPYLSFTRAANKIALYGPFWILMTGIPFFLGLGNFFLTLSFFKLVNSIFYLATILVIWKLRKNMFAVLLFALNPLIIIETLVSNHNDIAMMFFALASFLFIKEKKYFFALCLFALSLLIKYATLFLLPVLLYAFWLRYKNKTIQWEKIFFFATLAMLLIFFLSPLREEMYPWYAIWFLSFSFLIPEKKWLLYFSIAMTFGLLLRYIPFMYLGTYFGITPLIRIVLTIVPVIITAVLFLVKLRLSPK